VETKDGRVASSRNEGIPQRAANVCESGKFAALFFGNADYDHSFWQKLLASYGTLALQMIVHSLQGNGES
jgi:hypothetical protein